tara:strand:- start:308 stop:730 length:423 start_codon:yes stop_codon:yes gene_type:complete
MASVAVCVAVVIGLVAFHLYNSYYRTSSMMQSFPSMLQRSKELNREGTAPEKIMHVRSCVFHIDQQNDWLQGTIQMAAVLFASFLVACGSSYVAKNRTSCGAFVLVAGLCSSLFVQSWTTMKGWRVAYQQDFEELLRALH